MYSEKLKKHAHSALLKTTIQKTVEQLDRFCRAEDLNRVRANDVYDLYCEFCDENSIEVPTRQELGQAISKHFHVKSKNVRFKDKVAKVYFTDT